MSRREYNKAHVSLRQAEDNVRKLYDEMRQSQGDESALRPRLAELIEEYGRRQRVFVKIREAYLRNRKVIRLSKGVQCSLAKKMRSLGIADYQVVCGTKCINVYYGGLGSPCGPLHGHIVLEKDGKTEVEHRRPFTKRKEQ